MTNQIIDIVRWLVPNRGNGVRQSAGPATRRVALSFGFLVAALLPGYLSANEARAAQPCAPVELSGTVFRVAVVRVDCGAGRDLVERFYERLENEAPRGGVTHVGGFSCLGGLAYTELTCSRGEEQIFASSRPEDHPGNWSPPAPETAVKFRSGGSGIVVDLLLEGDLTACRDHPTRAAISLVDQLSKMTLRPSDVCRRGGWRKRGRAPGVTPSWEVWHSRHWSGSSVYLSESILPASREYRLKVILGGRHLHGWRTVHHELWTYKRVYEGSDAFINYCIDKNKSLRSSHGRLYCVRQVPGHSFMAIHPQRWHRR